MAPRMDISLAPVAVFAYRRVSHLSRVLDALEQCPEFPLSPVFVFSDGARSTDDAADVAAVRDLIRGRLRPNVRLVESDVNRGLAASIERAATQLSRDYGKVIVIEDDLVLAPCALTWLNAGLSGYQSADNVWQVSAHQFAVPSLAARETGLFLNFATSWAWGTWERAWDCYDPHATGWEALASNAELRRRFDFGGYPYSDMLLRQMTGQIDSWAVRWWWSIFRANSMTLFPPRSLVTNIGFDGSATHRRLGALRRTRFDSASTEAVCPRLPDVACISPADDVLLRAVVGASQSRGQRASARLRLVTSTWRLGGRSREKS